MGLSPDVVAAAYLAACHAELDALKPGNVHRFAGGHGMDVAVFETSARVSAPEIAAAGRAVGKRVLRAVEATWAAVGMNTNLGILLLAAPLAAAAEATGPARDADTAGRLRASLGEVLDGMTADDAANTFRAIAHASPGGLGSRAEHDVRTAPAIPLMEAMRIAAPKDLVARQYGTRFAGVFEVGLPALAAARDGGATGMWPAIEAFLAFASRFPDSHVARKHGDDAAKALRLRFEALCKRLNRMDNPEERGAELLSFDTALKAERLNPGTSADLTVASIFADGLLRQLEEVGRG